MLQDQITRAATRLSDEELTSAIRAAERCALCSTRTRRDLALLRLRCLRCEMERRSSEHSTLLNLVADS